MPLVLPEKPNPAEYVCPICGDTVEDGDTCSCFLSDKFCKNCGKPLTDENSTTGSRLVDKCSPCFLDDIDSMMPSGFRNETMELLQQRTLPARPIVTRKVEPIVTDKGIKITPKPGRIRRVNVNDLESIVEEDRICVTED